MITVALLGFIVVGLTAMFVQTQRAFRGGMAQTDVLETGRAVTDLLARELEGNRPTGLSGVTNFSASVVGYNSQQLPPISSSSIYRTNALSRIFFVTKYNQLWFGVGYVVVPVTNGVGTLYHYQWPQSGTNDPAGLARQFDIVAGNVTSGNITAYTNELHRMADGIVHLRVQTYSYATNFYTRDSWLISPNNGGFYNTNNLRNTISAQVSAFGQTDSAFTSNAVPAFVELELGVLEHQTLERFKALPSGTPQSDFLQKQAHRVHLFRRHIPIYNVDPEAYR